MDVSVNDPFSNSTMDACAYRLIKGQSVTEVHDYLVELGLSEYNSYLCYNAVMTLLVVGYYDRE